MLLKNLNPSQKEAVLHTEGPLIIFAGAGTGKTRVITQRVAYLLSKGIKPYNILAVTFTNKAAGEMKKRVEELAPSTGGGDVRISTFHAFCTYILSVEAGNFGLSPDFLIYDMGEQAKVIKECLKELNLDEKKYKPSWVVNRISRAKDDLNLPLDVEAKAIADGDFYQQMIAKIYRLYQEKLERYGALDFGDLIMQTVLKLQDHKEILAKYQDKFKYIMVDEYQDTNHSQYLLTKMLAEKHHNICVVGDDDQSIYSWRGADINNILEFEKDYPACKTVKLEENYRSTPKILSMAWSVIKNNNERVDKKLWTKNDNTGEINVFQNMNENDEALRTVDMILINKSNHNHNLSDFAIFYRTNAQSRALEDALRRSGIPYAIVGSLKFYERAEIKDIMAYLKLIHNPNDNVSFKRIVNIPKRGIGKTSMDKLEEFANDKKISLFEAIKFIDTTLITKSSLTGLNNFRNLVQKFINLKSAKTVKDIVEMVINETEYLKELELSDNPEAKSKAENIQELVSAIEDFQRRSPDQTLSGYLSQIALVSDIDSWENASDKVTLMTLHLAKGLEFKNVFIVGLEEGLFPIGESAYDQTELQEERRLMYVGMTRAKENLYMSWASERTVFGKTKWNVPSRFLLEAGFTEQLSTRSAQNNISSNFNYKKDFSQEPQYRQKNSFIELDEPPKIADNTPYSIGTMVMHPTFGNGKIIEKSGSGDDLKLVVLFGNGQWKKLIAKFANLTII
ncbi:MAG: UvrD-helicase domain-containing protein [Endomicrobiaceae bacterium]|jgi:DNA helicase-2/ATP-dependent DNA helicase PcrA|nr:UvrD-helicase domain-containing protein [Endomicrobiaceae bacterium]MDD3729595.1 UvrD-helicase domain-containing protein [Endomicrobiaceae bacterium]MDD4165688.1 UvrD-helicase domain-containing protein [Endomicrobiaceae bacterium]